jgi:hypothetical protein
MDEYRCPDLTEHYVRSSRQVLAAKSVSEASGVHATPNTKFGLRIRPADAPHHSTARGGIDDVCH